MEAHDNRVGLALALSSSAFIGASFIIKKKGLMRARSTGFGASAGGFAYLRESMWWLGMITMILGEAANFVAYTFAPAILVTPLGALSVIVSAILADRMLNEKLLLIGKLGCVLCLLGSTIIVLNAPEEAEITSVDQIMDRALTNLPFQFYVFFVLVTCVVLIFYYSPRIGSSNILVYIGICSLAGSLSVIGAKGLGIALKLTFSGNNQLNQGSTWAFVFLLVITISTQMNYLNRALDTFNTAVVSPIYYVFFTTLTIVASAILFEAWGSDPATEAQSTEEANLGLYPNLNCSLPIAGWEGHDAQTYGGDRFVTVLCAFLTICCGVFLLHISRQEAEEHKGLEGSLRQLVVGSARTSRTRMAEDDAAESIQMTELSPNGAPHRDFRSGGYDSNGDDDGGGDDDRRQLLSN